jgi:hypothetical protein
MISFSFSVSLLLRLCKVWLFNNFLYNTFSIHKILSIRTSSSRLRIKSASLGFFTNLGNWYVLSKSFVSKYKLASVSKEIFGLQLLHQQCFFFASSILPFQQVKKAKFYKSHLVLRVTTSVLGFFMRFPIFTILSLS